MWKKILAIIFLFFMFAILQNSFFAYFAIMGTVPNLVFIFFFILVFFQKKGNNFQVAFIAILAGIILDIYSYNKLGISIALLLLVGFSLKSLQSSLSIKEDNYPFAYYLPLFLTFFCIFEALLMVYSYFFESAHSLFSFDLRFAINLLCNLLLVSVGFLVYKKISLNVE